MNFSNRVFLVTIYFVASVIVNAFVLMRLWNWFLVPDLHWPVLLGKSAFGISLIVSYLFGDANMIQLDDEPSTKINFSILPILAFLIGWLVKML